MSVKNDLRSVLSDPRWLPSHWRAREGIVEFVHVRRERHGKLTFLSDEYLTPAQLPHATIGAAELLSAHPEQPPAPHFIFHTAFCCSTLLARALDIPGVAMALKEPQILNDFADSARSGALAQDVFAVALKLLARPFAAGERLIEKPSNVANLLAPALMNANADSRAIFLSSRLPRFLDSVAAKGLWGRRWARRLFLQLLADTGVQFGFGEAERFELSDLQAAALAWLLHRAQAAALIGQVPDRVRTLDSDDFLARKAETLRALGGHFQLEMSAEQAEQIAAGPAFATHSKKLGSSFDPDDSAESPKPVTIFAEEIAMVVTWTQHVADHVGIAMDFPAGAELLRG